MNITAAAPRPTVSLRDIVAVSRPFWWINTAAAFVAGSLLTVPALNPVLLIGALYFTLPFNLFMYGVNDIYDYESDIRNPRKTGIDGSVLPKAKHPSLWLAIFACNGPFWLYFLAVGSPLADAFFGLIIFMALAYSVRGLRFKEVPLLDSFTSSFHYTSPFILAILLQQGSEFWWPAFAAFFIWVMANHAFGAIQDITPDRQAGISSIATILGARTTILLCLAGYVLAAALPVVFYGTAGLAATLLLVPYVYLIAATLPQRHDDTAPIFGRTWTRFLYLNYAVGAALSMYLIFLSAR